MINSKITGIFRNIDESKIVKTAEILINNNINTATNPTTQQQNNQFVDRSNTLRCGGKKRIKHK